MPVGGEKDLVNNLIDKHKVLFYKCLSISVSGLIMSLYILYLTKLDWVCIIGIPEGVGQACWLYSHTEALCEGPDSWQHC